MTKVTPLDIAAAFRAFVWKLLIIIAVIALGILFVTRAHAATPAQLVLTWTASTTNTDGTAYIPAQVAGSNIYVAGSDAALTAMQQTCSVPASPATPTSLMCVNAILGASVLTYTTVGLAPGTYFFAVTTYTCPTPTTCRQSTQSPHVSGTVVLAVSTPKPPGSVSISATATATAVAP